MTPLLLRPVEAAKMCSCSRRHFDRVIAPQLSLVYSGRLVLIPVEEIERWIKGQQRPLP